MTFAIHLIALFAFIGSVCALTALFMHILGDRDYEEEPKHTLTWCDLHGHAFRLAENNRAYICGGCGNRVVRDADLYSQESGVGSAELGHRGQPGRAA